MTFTAHQHLEEIARFEKQIIPEGGFDHRAHVRTAWCYLHAAEPFQASARFVSALRRLTKALGAADKYHATITGFFLWLISERIANNPGEDWEQFERNNPDLFEQPKALLAAHYSDRRLNSALARRQFLLPDGVASNRLRSTAA